jgi:hypothetical protein
MPFTITKLPEKKEEEKPSGQFRISKKPESDFKLGQLPAQVALGGSDAVLDYAAMGALPLYPIEKGVQGLFGIESPEGGPQPLPGQAVRSNIESDILDKLNRGEKPSFSELMFLSDPEDVIPFSSPGAGTSLESVQRVQEEVPETGMTQEIARRGFRALPFILGGGGTLLDAMRAEFGGLASKELVKAMGGGETAQMWADIVGGFGASYKRTPSQADKVRIPYVAESQGKLAKIEAQAAPKALEKRLLSLGDEVLTEADKRMSKISNESLSDFGQFSARQTEDLITQANRTNLLNKVHPQEQLPQQAWKDISKATNEIFDAERKTYSDLYNSVRNAAKDIEYVPVHAKNVARSKLGKMLNLETMPSGYGPVKNLMESTLRDLGLSETTLDGLSALMVKKDTPITAEKLMDLSIRLNDAINYEALTPTIKDWLKPIQRAVKEDFRQAISKKQPLLNAFNKAEDLYKNTANRFGKDIISKLRSTENPELLGSDLLNPSNFENFKNVFGSGNAQVSKAERQLVDLIGKQQQKTAQETLRQLEPYLSQNAKTSAQESINLGDKLSTIGQRRAMQQNMITDVADAINTGNRPTMTVTAMRTPQGYQISKDAFNRTSQGKKLFKVLEKQVVEDLFNSITKDGQIDWNKAKKILSDPGYEQVMTEIMGIDGVQMIKNIEKWSQNITANLGNIQFSQPSTFNKFVNLLDTPAKLMMASFFGPKIGTVLGVAVSAKMLKDHGARLITSQSARDAMRSFADKNITGNNLLRSAVILNDASE